MRRALSLLCLLVFLLSSEPARAAAPLATRPTLPLTVALAPGVVPTGPAAVLAHSPAAAPTATPTPPPTTGPGPADAPPTAIPTIPRTTLAALGAVSEPGMLWQVPFRSQVDGTPYASSNCGPASLAMILEAFGIAAPTDVVRSFVNLLSGNHSVSDGTSLDYLVEIAEANGLEGLNLYSGGRYRRWTPELLREHLRQAHPIITLVKYRSLPGNESSRVEADHYIVLTGFLGGSFIYNDAGYANTSGRDRVIGEDALRQAWEGTLVPGMAVAFAPGPDHDGLWLVADWQAEPPVRGGGAQSQEDAAEEEGSAETVDDRQPADEPTAPPERPTPPPTPTESWRWPSARYVQSPPTPRPAATIPASAETVSQIAQPTPKSPPPRTSPRSRREQVDLSVSPLAFGAVGLLCLGLVLYRALRRTPN